MSDKFQNKYRNESARAQWWDYGNNGAYFVTICTKNREHFFGEIVNSEMVLSETGKLCEKYLNEIPEHFPFVLLDSSAVMPDHVHAIIVIDKPAVLSLGTLQCNIPATTITNSSVIDNNNEKTKNIAMASISPKSGSLSAVVRSFKSAVTRDAHLIRTDFEWQPRFHDHIIRDEKSFQRIKNYILNNPKNWKENKSRDYSLFH